jgi:hypothetical protein
VDGISVASSHEAAKRTIARGNGVATVRIDAIPQLGLGLVQDDDDHGCITGIPYAEDDYDLAMNLADKLLALSVVTLDRWTPA